jgi:hypothetical protein
MTWRLSAFNVGPAVGASGWTLTLLLPKNSAPTVPTSNALLKCVGGTTSGGFPLVRCTGKGPLSPGVTSMAVDVVAHVPAATPPSAELDVAAYVQPVASQGPETSPLGTPPVSPAFDAGNTATDNDYSASITMQP